MKIIFCGGGTLGSVTPLVATIEKLKEIEPKVEPIWIGTRRGVERSFIGKLGIEYHWISAGKLRRYFDLRTLFTPFVAAAAIVQSAWLILKIRPKAVVVSGSFVQVPLVMVARIFGVPIVLHQEDIEVGLANRISAYDAKVITATFDVSASRFGKRAVKVIGNPVRKLISDLADPAHRAALREQGMKRWNLDVSKPMILVLGGGTGAMGLNERVVKNLDALLSSANVINLTGKGKIYEVPPRRNFVSIEFLNEEMAEAYAAADLVVSRAGLGTLTELGVAGLPTVLVPLPGHQEKNAAYLRERNAAIVIANDSSDQVFVDTVLRLLHDRDQRLMLSRAIAEIFPADAAEKLAKIIIQNIK